MTLEKTISQGRESLTIVVDYSYADKEVKAIKSVWADNGKTTINITHIMAEHFNLDEVVDGINWPEIAAEAEDDMQPPCEDDDEECWRD